MFGRSVVTLASGTAMAQLLLALAMPVLTRLYTPTDYGSLAVYASTLTVLLVLASLRYEVAIPLAGGRSDRRIAAGADVRRCWPAMTAYSSPAGLARQATRS